jgi:hypothetical protein
MHVENRGWLVVRDVERLAIELLAVLSSFVLCEMRFRRLTNFILCQQLMAIVFVLYELLLFILQDNNYATKLNTSGSS